MPHSSCSRKSTHWRGKMLGCSALFWLLMAFELLKLGWSLQRVSPGSGTVFGHKKNKINKKCCYLFFCALLRHWNSYLKSTLLAISLYCSKKAELPRDLVKFEVLKSPSLSQILRPCLASFVHPPPPKWASLPAMGMRGQEIGLCDDLCLLDDEQALVSEHFNVWTDSALISSSNDHFTVYCCSNCMFCSLCGCGAPERKASLPLPLPRNSLSHSSFLFLLHLSPLEDAAYLWSLFCLNEAWQIRSSQNHVA